MKRLFIKNKAEYYAAKVYLQNKGFNVNLKDWRDKGFVYLLWSYENVNEIYSERQFFEASITYYFYQLEDFVLAIEEERSLCFSDLKDKELFVSIEDELQLCQKDGGGAIILFKNSIRKVGIYHNRPVKRVKNIEIKTTFDTVEEK